MFVAFLAVIAIAYFMFKKRNIPTQSLYIASFIIIPVGLVGASILGKADAVVPILWWQYFAFWLPGMSIHGGLLFGFGIGWIWFHYESKKYSISLWVYAEMLVPQLLLAQAIGRWGNFFNHELLGSETTYEALSWLPGFIKNNLFKWYIPDPIPDGYYPVLALAMNGGYIDPSNHEMVQYFQPLFLYESFANVVGYLIISILIPKTWYLSYSSHLSKRFGKDPSLTRKGWWDKYYFDIKPHLGDLDKIQNNTDHKKIYFKDIKKTTQKSERFKHYIKYQKNRFNSFLKRDVTKLESLHNPHKILPIRVGLQTSLYLIWYNVFRLILEIQRAPEDLLISNGRAISYTIIAISIGIGVLMLIFSQFLCVIKYRKKGWLYEKQY
ncbi:prolipoprotein diacylglyceryl transferase [Spiroplasma endosymbiont of Anurida maritima]|uniref:prolipoprotein diacylglyceryl transferase family protein n=1 Tax=Spiroplasma endosymbiont of Anurida maritima TaxID=2967972 RepID=UPI0036D3A736